MTRLIRAGFRLLYTRFAGLYDVIANLVSFGEWREWGAMALTFIPDGARVLEIGHGPGHLYARILERGLRAVGVDLSPEMGALARRNLVARGAAPALARADAGRLPIADAAFDCLVCAFPTDFIFSSSVLAELRRVLAPGGRVVVVPGARLIKNDPFSRLVRLAYRLTGQGSGAGDLAERVRPRFEAAGFRFWQRHMGTPRAAVTVWVLRV